MLHRAASNAYSWWWASHIRTKQSKWLDNNLQDVEVKVESMLKLIEEDGDSFAQKAEMYYRKRPELVKFVEEFYRAYRALAERYDHISGELHKANKTLATVFPDQLQLAIADGEEIRSDKALSATVFPGRVQLGLEDEEDISSTAAAPPGDPTEIPGPSLPKDLEKVTAMATKLRRPERVDLEMGREKAQEEIDKLQKGILILQTEKEFIKSCYESNLAKYWDIERRMTDMQRQVCNLQDDYNVSVSIEDDEARALMTATALKSCEAALVNLQEQQKQSMEEARLESDRIRAVRAKLMSLKAAATATAKAQGEESSGEAMEPSSEMTVEPAALAQERLELQFVCEKIKEHFEKASVEELAEKIDELVDKIISLEVTVSSQTAQILRLRSETDELQRSLQSFEEEEKALAAAAATVTAADNAAADDDGDHGSGSLSEKLKDAEEELGRLQSLDKSVRDETQKLQVDFSSACRSFRDLSEKLQSADGSCSSQEDRDGEEEEEGIKAPTDESNHGLATEASCSMLEPGLCAEDRGMEIIHSDPGEELPDQKQEDEIGKIGKPAAPNREDGTADPEGIIDDSSWRIVELEQEDQSGENNHAPRAEFDGMAKKDLVLISDAEDDRECEAGETGPTGMREEDEEDRALDWQQLLLIGLEDREKLLLAEYTSILRNYKETKRKLSEAERRHEQHLLEMMAKVRDLKNAGAMKDEEILSLRQKLQFLEANQENPGGYSAERRDPQSQAAGEKEEASPSSFSTFFAELKDEGGDPEGLLAKEINLQVPDKPETENAVEGRFRRDIDGLLEENLEFWLRFSASFQQIQKLQTAWRGLQGEIANLSDGRKTEGGGAAGGGASGSSSDAVAALFTNLADLQTELLAWLDQNAQLKAELQCRFSSLCNIKDEMSRVLSDSAGTEEAPLTPYQAAKFHGELLNMQQENNKVADELQAGLDHVKALQAEVDRSMAGLRRNLGISPPAKAQPHYHFRHFSGRTRVPLRSFLFGPSPSPRSPPSSPA
ncbi:unnamed protein product [Spirodela intermedia]|uniref:NAB domain-containing protein n=1 Tax=Spirodela intermedia TaxID=51605 RepID=A0A7I8IYZ0_SPIIN|nr:unnamed protein product [Spirodela intermedia]CAA6663088.1 unnamed protein product [Spirodela intermedia]